MNRISLNGEAAASNLMKFSYRFSPPRDCFVRCVGMWLHFFFLNRITRASFLVFTLNLLSQANFIYTPELYSDVFIQKFVFSILLIIKTRPS